MNLSCNQDTLARYISIVNRAIASKSSIPILSNIYMETNGEKLLLSSTDLEISVKCWLGAKVSSQGKTTVPAKQFSEFVSTISSEKIDLLLEESVVSVLGNNSSAKFNTMPVEDFPSLLVIDGVEPIFSIKKDAFAKVEKRIAFSVASDDVKPVLTGIKIEIADKEVAFVGTDGLRLSRQIIHLDKSVDEKYEFLIPAKALKEVAYITSQFPEINSDVEVYSITEKNSIAFKFNDIILVARLIEGVYPDYKQIIPTAYRTLCEIKKSDFVNSLKVVNIIARNVLGNKLLLEIDPTESKIKLSASLNEVGSNVSSFDCKVEGEPQKLAFSSKFLNDILNNLDDEEISFESASDIENNLFRPGMIKIKGDSDYLHLIMPMRI